MSYCGQCGREMKPLLFSEYCPSDCDREPEPLPPAWPTEPNSTWEFADADGPLDLTLAGAGWVKSAMCSQCGSTNSEPFPHPVMTGAVYCIACGHVW